MGKLRHGGGKLATQLINSRVGERGALREGSQGLHLCQAWANDTNTEERARHHGQLRHTPHLVCIGHKSSWSSVADLPMLGSAALWNSGPALASTARMVLMSISSAWHKAGACG